MDVYRIHHYHPNRSESVSYRGTKKEAHLAAKEEMVVQSDIHIDLIVTPGSKDALLNLLNDPKAAFAYPVVRSWHLTNRGGLTETFNEDRHKPEPQQSLPVGS